MHRARAGRLELSRRRQDPRGGPLHGRAGHPPGLRLLRRARRLRARVRRGGPRVHRAAARGDREHGRQDHRPPPDGGGGRAGRPGHDATARLGGGRARDGACDRLPRRVQDRRRRRRQGLSRGALRGGVPRRVRASRERGSALLRERRRLRRGVPRGSAACRGADPRGLARQRRPPRRARLLDPAAAPEARRGGAGAERHAGVARADLRDRGRGRARRRLPGSRHRRGPARRRALFLPRDEHAAAGRASRDGDGDRDRHRARADPRRSGRAALVPATGRRHPRPCDRMPHQRRVRAPRLRPAARDDHALRGAGRPGSARRLGRLRRLGRAAVLRLAAGQAHRVGRHARGRYGPDAAGARGVPHRGHRDARAVPPRAAGERGVVARRDRGQPARRPGLARRDGSSA